jgi:hypothetical protein
MEPAIEQLLGLTPQQNLSPRPTISHSINSNNRPVPVSPEIASSFNVPHVRSPYNSPPVSTMYPPPSVTNPSYPSYPSQQNVQNIYRNSGVKRWRHVLPPDFLTLPYEVIVIASNQAAVAQRPTSILEAPPSQLDGDEALALMLQNENFLEQLQNDPEFAAFLIQNPRVARQLGINASMIPQPSIGDLQQQQQMNQEQERKSRQRLNSLELGDDKQHQPRQSQKGSGSGGNNNATQEWDIGSGLSSMGAGMKRRMGLIAARFRRQNAAPSTSSSSFSSSSLPNATTSSSFGSGARGLMSHVSSFFDGKGAYASLPHSTSADLKLDDDVQPPRPNSAGAHERSERVRKMGGATSPASPTLGSSKFGSGSGKNNLGSPIGIGMVDLDLSGGSIIDSSGGGGRGFVAKPTPKQRTFDVQDEDEDENNESASLTKSYTKRI